MSGTGDNRDDLEFPQSWNDDVVDDYIKPESQQKSREQFIDTHIPIDQIETEWLKPHPGVREFVSQEEFRDAILQSDVEDDNRIFILQGETGSGKSQLCQWLGYQIGGQNDSHGDNDQHVALHVSRSETRIKDILEIFTEPLDMDVSTKSLDGLDPEKVAGFIREGIYAMAENIQGADTDDLRKLSADEGSITLRGILEENIEEYQSVVTSDGERDLPDLINDRDYRDLAMDAFGAVRGRNSIFPVLRDEIHNILSRHLGVGDFRVKLEELSQKYVEEGIRPVLICEDVTTFSFLKQDLLDHLFQLDAGSLDVVLGWTTGWEQDNLDRALGASNNVQTYMEERAEGYLSTTDDSGRAHFLDENVSVELVRKYMSVIHENSENRVHTEQSAYDNLYPFNSNFIRRAYDNLVDRGDERRTPRLLLIRVIQECLNSYDPPFVTAESNPYLKEFPVEIDLGYDSVHKTISKWYGKKTLDGNVAVPIEVAETFNVDYETEWVRESESGSEIVYDAGGFDLSLSMSLDGTRSPGNEISFRANVDNQRQEDVMFTVDGEEVGKTDGSGEVDFVLPNKETEITVTAEKQSLSTTNSYEIAPDTLDINPSKKLVEPGENLRLTVTYNGEKIEDVELVESGQPVGETDASGTVVVSPEINGDSLKYEVEYEGLNARQTIETKDPAREFPVNTELSPDEVKRRETEYQSWVSQGEEYDSSDTLIDGAVSVLQRFDTPTELRNPNALSNAGDAIYFDRGDHIPISLQGAYDSQASLSAELPFGIDNSEIYKVLFWTGIGEDGLPDSSMVSTDYDKLRGWANDIVGRFREDMRATIEECLPDEMGIEEFIVYYRFLIHNTSCGRMEINDEIVLAELESQYVDYDSPMKKRFNETDGIREAYGDLMMNKTASRELAKSFFLLKGGRGKDREGWFVDRDRLDSAMETVRVNRDRFLKESMQIDTSDLPAAFRVKSSRSASKTAPLDRMLEAMRETAREIINLDYLNDADHVSEDAERVNEWFDKSLKTEEIKQEFKTVLDAVDDLPVANKEDVVEWEKTLKEIDGKLALNKLESEITHFKDIESSGSELVSDLHAFESTLENLLAWNVYNDLGEMIEEVDDYNPGNEDSFDKRVRQLDSYTKYQTCQNKIELQLENL